MTKALSDSEATGIVFYHAQFLLLTLGFQSHTLAISRSQARIASIVKAS